MTRIAKYDIQIHAEKQVDDCNLGSYDIQHADYHNWQHLLAQAGVDGAQPINMQDLLANDGLNDEIKKLL